MTESVTEGSPGIPSATAVASVSPPRVSIASRMRTYAKPASIITEKIPKIISERMNNYEVV